jgi:REP element-mobilizing transposase RayT
VTARGNERRKIYLNDADRRHFCQLLEEMVLRFRLRLHAYVLLDNHYHLMVEVVEPNLSRAMQWLNVSYSVWFNRKHQRSGHLFQGRFKSVVVDPAVWALALSRYVHLNPVRLEGLGLGKRDRQKMRVGASGSPDARVVQERLSRLRRYPWSSYPAYVGWITPPGWLKCEAIWELGGGKKTERPRRYRQYVEMAVREGLEENPWDQLKEQVVLGGEEFMKQLRSQVKGDRQEQRAGRRLAATGPALEEVIKCVERIKGEKWQEFRDRHGDSGRDLVLYLGRRVCGWKLKDLAEAVEASEYAAVAMAVKRFGERILKSKSDRQCAQRVCQMLNVKM